ncbi:MAG: hypothetical protein KBC11_00455 [Candidatus Pacebacteria bacterium]|nr:hypothetical protein [Candidatus Paceibacterota bacterium]
MENIMENQQSPREVGESLGVTCEQLKTEVQELMDKNEYLAKAINKFGGIGMFNTSESFRFNAFSGSESDSESIYRLIDSKDNLIEHWASDGKQISNDGLLSIKEELENRKTKIIEALSKDFSNEDEAYEAVESIHSEYITPSLNKDPIFI